MRHAVVAIVVGMVLSLVPACAPKAARSALEGAGAWGAVGGLTITRDAHEIRGTRDKHIYLTERYSLEAYRIAVPNGTYTVTLHFAETYEGITAAGERVFSVSVEGKPVLVDLDPFKEAGGKAFAAVVKTCKANVADGELTIGFQKKTQNPLINGIEVTVKGGSMLWPRETFALRINCGATKDYTDNAGRIWKQDRLFAAQ